MQGGRRLAAEALDKRDRCGGAVELVHVVEDEHDVVAEMLVERTGEQRCERLGGGPVATASAGDQRAAGEWIVEIRHGAAHRRGDTRREHGE